MRTDDGAVVRRQSFVGQPEPFGDIAPQVVRNRIGAFDQAVEDGLAFGRRNVERQAFLVEVDRLEEEARVVRIDAIGKIRAETPRVVAPEASVFHLDDLAAEIGEMLGSKRAGAVLLDRENARAFERSTHVIALQA